MPMGPWSPSQLRGPGKGASIGGPANTAAPVISGTMQIGSALSTTNGSWSSPTTPTFTYQWQRAGVNIASATASTYTLVATDIGPSITCNVTATNAVGSKTAASNALAYTFAADANILDGLLGSQYVSGTNWPSIKAVGTATLNSAVHVTASTLAGQPSVNFDANAAAYVTVTGLGTALATQSGCTVFSVMKTGSAGLAGVWEYVSTANMAMDVHDSDTAEILPAATYWTTWNTPDPATAAASWSWHFNRTVSSGVAGVRKGGVAVTTAQHGTAATPGGNYASGNLTLGNRSDHAIPCVLNLSIFLMTTSALAVGGNPALTIEAALSYFGGV